jgi:hypothetical protein
VVVVALLLVTRDGGYAAADWYPAAVFILALGIVTLCLGGVDRGGAFWAASAALGAFTLWCYASIAWAANPADAWDGANRALLYWATFTVVGSRPWTRRSTDALLTTIVGGTSLVAAGVLLFGLVGEASSIYVLGRLSEPTGYANATAALLLIPLWPAVHLALDRRRAGLLRVASIAVACGLLETAVLTESRGGAITAVVSAAVFLALSPRRLGALGAMLLLSTSLTLSWHVLTAVIAAGDSTQLEIAHRAATARIGIDMAAVSAVFAAALLAGRMAWGSAGPPARLTRAGTRGLAAAAASAAVACGVLVAMNGGWIDARWRDFKTAGYTAVDRSSTRFTGSLGSGRYDFYRVALGEFRRHPVRGIGIDNFAVPYLAQRRTDEAPAHPHGLAFRVLSQLGIVGALLGGGFLVLVAYGYRSHSRDRDARDAAAQAAALVGGIVWLVHALGDWLWAMPSSTILGFALFAVAANPARGPETGGALAATRRLRRRWLIAGALPAALLSGSLLLPWLAERYERAGRDALAENPERAYASYRRAGDLNPLSADPLIAGGVIARELGAADLARTAFRDALSREPSNWLAHFELSLLDLEAGQREPALGHLHLARRLNPGQAVLTELQRRLRQGESPDTREFERRLYRDVRINVDPTG